MAGYIGSKASVVSSGAENKKVITATAGQTAFTGLTYSPNRVHVFQNGVRLVDGTDYTATDGNSLTLTVGAAADDQVVVVSYSGFQTSDTVSSSAGGTFTGDVNFTGSFTSQGIDDNATSTAMTLDGSGNLLVGKNALSGSTAGTEIFSVGLGRFVRSGGDVLNLNRLSTDGTIVDIQKDGASVGGIGVASSAIHLGNQDTGIRFAGGSDAIQPWNTGTNAARDAAIDLGLSTARFKDLYLSGGAYLGGTGSSNKLDDYEEGTFTPTLVGTGTAGVRSGNSVSRGKYTKVGNLVHFQLYVDANSWSTAPSGFLRIGNLPFSNSSTTASENTGSVMHNAYNFSYTTLVYYMASGVNELRLYSLGDNVGWIQASIGNESMNFYITGTYATT